LTKLIGKNEFSLQRRQQCGQVLQTGLLDFSSGKEAFLAVSLLLLHKDKHKLK